MSATPFETQVEFELPKGYIDKTGEVHKKGVMRLANAADGFQRGGFPRAVAAQNGIQASFGHFRTDTS